MTPEEQIKWQNHQSEGMRNIAPRGSLVLFEFGIGDVVQLKCGGPAMVIVSYESGLDRPEYNCCWMDDNFQLKDTFMECSLKRLGWLDRLFL